LAQPQAARRGAALVMPQPAAASHVICDDGCHWNWRSPAALLLHWRAAAPALLLHLPCFVDGSPSRQPPSPACSQRLCPGNRYSKQSAHFYKKVGKNTFKKRKQETPITTTIMNTCAQRSSQKGYKVPTTRHKHARAHTHARAPLQRITIHPPPTSVVAYSEQSASRRPANTLL